MNGARITNVTILRYILYCSPFKSKLMKGLLVGLFFLIGIVENTEAQSEFEHLLTKQLECQEAYTAHAKPANRRKLNRAEDKLMDYLKENGYSLTVALRTEDALPLYESTNPKLGTASDSLQGAEEIRIFTKDEYGYYKVLVGGKIGYVYSLGDYLADTEDYPLALVDKYAAMQARVNAMMGRSLNNIPPDYNSRQCSGSHINGAACGNSTRDASGRCFLHR
jgi:hypothetical protein